MSIEVLQQPKRPITLENEASFTKELNRIQAALMEIWTQGDKSKEAEWVENFSKFCREVILRPEIELNPFLIDEWDDETKRPDLINRLADMLYTDHPLDKAA